MAFSMEKKLSLKSAHQDWLAWPTFRDSVLRPTALGTVVLFCCRYLVFGEQDTEGLLAWLSYVLTVLEILALALAIYWHISYVRGIAREYFLKYHLKADCSFGFLFRGRVFLRLVATVLSLAFAVITYVVLQTLDLWDILVIAFAMFFALIVQAVLRAAAKYNFKSSPSEKIITRWATSFAVLLVTFGLVGTRLIHDFMSSDFKKQPTQYALELEKDVAHPNTLIRIAVKGLKYFDYVLAHAREELPKAFGWPLYLFFLLTPSMLPSYGFASTFLGFCPNPSPEDT